MDWGMNDGWVERVVTERGCGGERVGGAVLVYPRCGLHCRELTRPYHPTHLSLLPTPLRSISQTSQVRVIYLLTAGTCDEHMRRTVVSKLCNIGTVLDGKAGKLASQTAPPAAQAGPDIGSYFARQAASQAATLGPGEAAGAGAGGAASGIDDADLVELVGWAEARGAMGGSGAGAGSGAAMSGLMREEGARAPPPVGQSSGPGPGSGSSPGPLQRACANAGPRGQGGVLPGNGPPAKRARTGGRVVAVD